MNRTLYFVLFLLSINSYSQSPWINKKGSIYSQISLTYLSYNNIIRERAGDITTSNYNIKDITSGVYGNYSITDKSSVIINLPYKSVEYNNESLSGIGDATFKIKHRLPIKIPFAIYSGYTAPLSQRKNFLRTGYKQHAIEMGLSIGFSKQKYYTYTAFGYKYRANIPDQAIINTEFGYKLKLAKKTMYVILNINGALNTSLTEDDEGLETALYHNNGQYLSPGLKLAYNPIDNFSINLSAFGAFIARQMGAAPTINMGIAYHLKK